tara:strand:+ start:135 stop:839 length:705 start_codon:yes stop_codon:yes gene_type:complete
MSGIGLALCSVKKPFIGGNMKRLLVLAIASFALVACDEVTGPLTVEQPIELLKGRRQGDLGNRGSFVIPVGTQNITLEFNRRNINLKAGDESARFFLSSARELPTDGGAFTLPSSESGQPYDLAAEVSVNYDRGQWVQTFEPCVENVPVRRCVWRRDSNGRQYRQCHIEYRTLHGERRVVLRSVRKTTVIDGSLTDVESETVAGHFETDRTDTSHEYDYRGDCRVRNPYLYGRR